MLPPIFGNAATLPPSSSIIQLASQRDAIPSNLRQGLLRPQSGVGNLTEDWRVEDTLPLENQPLHAIFHPFPAIFRCKIAKNGIFAAENHVKTIEKLQNKRKEIIEL